MGDPLACHDSVPALRRRKTRGHFDYAVYFADTPFPGVDNDFMCYTRDELYPFVRSSHRSKENNKSDNVCTADNWSHTPLLL